jgi:tetratricopeptide (TPR) repeat protein
METSKHVQSIPPARGVNRLVTVACLGLLAFNAFHLFGGCQAFLRYKAFLERNPREVEQLVSTIYSLHPSLLRANQFDRKQLEFFSAGQHEKVSNCFERALALRKEVYGADSPKICQSLNSLGCSYIVEKKFAAAEVAFKRSLEICQSNHQICQSYKSPGAVESLDCLAYLFEIQKRYAEAESCEQRAIGLLIDHYGNDSQCASQYQKLAELHRQQAKYQLAISFYKKKLAIHEPIFGVNDQDSIYIREQIAECLALSRRS